MYFILLYVPESNIEIERNKSVNTRCKCTSCWENESGNEIDAYRWYIRLLYCVNDGVQLEELEI